MRRFPPRPCATAQAGASPTEAACSSRTTCSGSRSPSTPPLTARASSRDTSPRTWCVLAARVMPPVTETPVAPSSVQTATVTASWLALSPSATPAAPTLGFTLRCPSSPTGLWRGGRAEHCSVCCTVLYCTVLYCTVLYCTVLYCAVLYRTVLYCAVT